MVARQLGNHPPMHPAQVLLFLAPLAKLASALPVRPAPLEGRVCHIEAVEGDSPPRKATPPLPLQTPGLSPYFLLTASFVVAVHSYLSSASIESNIDALPSSLETPLYWFLWGGGVLGQSHSAWDSAWDHTLASLPPPPGLLPQLLHSPMEASPSWANCIQAHVPGAASGGETHPMTDSKALLLIPMLYFQKSLALSLHRVPI